MRRTSIFSALDSGISTMFEGLSLAELLIGAAESPPSSRIEFRDPIARHRSAGVDAVRPWLEDRYLTAFAIRVIRRSADFGARDHAIAVLRAAVLGLSEPHLTDARVALAELGGREAPIRSPRTSSAEPSFLMSSNELVIGKVYRRKDLHDSGLGGNRQKGISYGANATEVLLLSDPGTHAEWGYRDSWQGPDRFAYYGEWNGAGDMTFSGGNQAILDRSPEIYLFTRTTNGHEYAGRFACEGWDYVPASRDGRPWKAIVFRLSRA
jgi:hypothetical protein